MIENRRVYGTDGADVFSCFWKFLSAAISGETREGVFFWLASSDMDIYHTPSFHGCD